MMPLNVVRLSDYLRGLIQHARAVLALLVALLVLLLLFTSLISSATVLSDTFVDIAIYTIYLLFILVLSSTAFVLYALFDSDSSLFSCSETERADRLETASQYKAACMQAQDPSRPEPEKGMPSALSNETKRSRLLVADEAMTGFALAEAYDEKQMAAHLMQQHPQVAAVTLMLIDSKKAAAVLDRMARAQSESIRGRIEKTETERVSGRALKVLDLALQKELVPLPHDRPALNHLSSADIREILRHIDKKELMYLLQGAAQELQERFFANMSSKASIEFKTIMASAAMPETIKRQNALRRVSLLAEQLRDNDKIRENNTGQR
jgi:hypothetical protein